MLEIVAVAFCAQWTLYVVWRASAAPTTPSTTVMDFIYKDEGDYYNPNEGYEPYWPDGEWVFELPRDRDLNASTTKWPLVCGEECIYLYTRIGKVCGHVSDDVTYYGCTASFCSGWYVDDLTGGFKTFDTYCNFLDVQCRNKFHSSNCLIHFNTNIGLVLTCANMSSSLIHFCEGLR
ncbi:hypothetical protein O3G_MSEX008033 [Manduca sexta]|uniref:Uncharacterized protein n=1 Tax=Manduca sexta TaxID=7130 RepID=A0A921Z8W2_MANSE|nr:hypothetical protein O3G_MSEX008033 [Manduca sexta]